MSKWTYGKLADAHFDVQPFPTNEEERLEFRRKLLALYEEAGWTEGEFDAELGRRLDIRFAKDQERSESDGSGGSELPG